MKASRLERKVGLVLAFGSAVSVGLLTLGIVAMGASRIGPLDRPFPRFDLGRIAADLVAIEPAGFLWLGLLAVILTPSFRVAASFLGFAASGERRMAAVALVVLAVICLSAILGAGG
jgi:uncharacterized membrane protein